MSAWGSGSQDESTRGWFPLGEPLRRAFVRTTPLAVVVLAFVLAALVTDELSRRLGGDAGAAAYAVSRAAFVAFLLALAVDLSVTLVNRPKMVVPPGHRDDPGALAMWWHAPRELRAERGGGRREPPVGR